MEVASLCGDFNLISGVTHDVLMSLRINSGRACAVPGVVETFGPRDIVARYSVSPYVGTVAV